jgi:hypothetical protein
VGDRVTVVLDDGCAEMLVKIAGGPRKQGEYLSRTIKALYTSELHVYEGSDLEQMRMVQAHLSGKVKELEGRLLQVESRNPR